MRSFFIFAILLFIDGSISRKSISKKNKKSTVKHGARFSKTNWRRNLPASENSDTKSTILVPVTTPDDGTALPLLGPSLLTFDNNNERLPMRDLIKTKPVNLEDVYHSLFSKNMNNNDKDEDADEKDEIITEDNYDDDDDDGNSESEKLELYKNLLYNKELLANAVIKKYYDKLIAEPSANPNYQHSADLGMEGGTIQQVVQDLSQKQSQNQNQQRQKTQTENGLQSVDLSKKLANTVNLQTPTTTVLSSNIPLMSPNSALNTYLRDTKPAPIYQQTAPKIFPDDKNAITYQSFMPNRIESPLIPLLQGRNLINSENTDTQKEEKKQGTQDFLNNDENDMAGKLATLIDSGSKQTPYVDKAGLHLNFEYDRDNFKMKDIWHSAFKAKDLYDKIQSMDENLINYLSDTGKTLAKYLDKKKKEKTSSKHATKTHKNQSNKNKSRRIKLFAYLLEKIKNMTEDGREDVFNKLTAIVNDNQKARIALQKNSTMTISNNTLDKSKINNTINSSLKPPNEQSKSNNSSVNDKVVLQKTMEKIDVLMGYLLTPEKHQNGSSSSNASLVLNVTSANKFKVKKPSGKQNITPSKKILLPIADHTSKIFITSIKLNKPSSISINIANKSQISAVHLSKNDSKLTQSSLVRLASNANLLAVKSLTNTKITPRRNSLRNEYSLLKEYNLQNEVEQDIGHSLKKKNSTEKALSINTLKGEDRNKSMFNVRHTRKKTNNLLQAKSFKNKVLIRPSLFRNVIIETEDGQDKPTYTGKNVFIWKNHTLKKTIKSIKNTKTSSKTFNKIKIMDNVLEDFDTPDNITVPINSINTSSSTDNSTVSKPVVDEDKINALRTNISNKLFMILKSVEKNVAPKNKSAIEQLNVNGEDMHRGVSKQNETKNETSLKNNKNQNKLQDFLHAEEAVKNQTENNENNTMTDYLRNEGQLLNKNNTFSSLIQQRNINASWKEEIASQLKNFFRNILDNTKKKVLIPRAPSDQLQNHQTTEKKIHIEKPYSLASHNNSTKKNITVIPEDSQALAVQPAGNNKQRFNETLTKLVPLMPIPLVQKPILQTQVLNNTSLLKSANISTDARFTNSMISSDFQRKKKNEYMLKVSVDETAGIHLDKSNGSVRHLKNNLQKSFHKGNKKANKWILKIIE